jgi:hypothetical protein
VEGHSKVDFKEEFERAKERMAIDAQGATAVGAGFAKLVAAGGRAKSAAKAPASRENGKRRPG